MPKHLQTGHMGEKLAATMLQQKGYEILACNARYGKAEIDIIAKYQQTMVFVEVKTRTNLSYGMPESFVSTRKAQLVTQAADEYVHAEGWHGNIRFDVVAVVLSESQPEITHFEDAFY